MRNKLAVTKNVGALQLAFESLAIRGTGIPGMGLVYGYTGAGKTTAVTWLINKTRGVFVRATATWTSSAMLGRIMVELGAEPLSRGSAAMVDHIVRTLAREQRPLFVDEADYLARDVKMLETLRDIHDLSGQPVILIGMEGIERRLVHRQQLARRISQWVEFAPSDLDDARTIADTVCEVYIEQDLLEAVHAEAKGSVGLMVVGLARIEAYAKGNGLEAMGGDRWGGRKLFLGAPRFAKAA